MAGSLAALAAAELDLQHLAAEALRALPAVKDVAERVVFELRGLQQVSRASGGSGELAGAALASLKAQWLHPFLIACNHTGAPKRVLTIALGALQRLITSDGVAPGDMLGIARVLEIQVRLARMIFSPMCTSGTTAFLRHLTHTPHSTGRVE